MHYLAEIDSISNSGNSIFHRLKAVSKMFFALFVLMAIVVSDNIIMIGGVMIVLMGILIFSKIPLKTVCVLALYPAFFSLIFAAIMMQQSVQAGVLVIFKAVGAALNMILLITTTSYIDIFKVLSIFLPDLLVDIFLFTYRSLFIFIDQIGNLIKSMRLRGGYRSFNIFANLKNVAGALGVMVIHSIDMSNRMYQIFSLRGYDGGIINNYKCKKFCLLDYLYITLSIIILTGVIVF
ncbi:energy-coupling factor transporter transmembrane component T [Herbivorax sp. ANBcel31]|uniref:energy-coupling factor transporter transmembrane component T family protein n=1 Tax=Herbivorax sp. ANBcel31 TaxID=3069754 RepID=UPI0027B846CF|nr:energy-coupling factor transporter transmembrane component T [Herbivorax sp. ANBcel31]MDQ2088083.1 energy-coupling factor transporter transmembrane component T [Herbivorax sp. ANBcel31]